MGDTCNCIKEGELAEIRTEVGALKQDVSSLKKLYNLISEQTNNITVLTEYRDWETDRKSTRLNSSHSGESRMPSSA